MWRELLKVLKSGDPLQAMADEFLTMLAVCNEMAAIVRPHVFTYDLAMEQRSKVYKLDIKVNKGERAIRKRIATHLALSGGEVPYCLTLMSLVKDAERIGDYIKNISEIGELGGKPVPESDHRTELFELVDLAYSMLAEAPNLIKTQDTDRAVELLSEGRNGGKRCDRLLIELAHTELTPAQTTSMVLLTRFHKRLGSHTMNILSSIVMPMHKVDFLDFKELEGRDPV